MAKLGVALESAADLSRENGMPVRAEYCKEVLHNSVRSHVDVVPGGNETGTRLTRADT